MPQIKVTCACCGQVQFCMSPRRGSAGLAEIAARLSEQGWSGSVVSGAATCSEECRATVARDVTPETPALESR